MFDATVIVQHLASVLIFCCCFVAIFQRKASPVAVVGWASLFTVLAWTLWDYWMRRESKSIHRMYSDSSHVDPRKCPPRPGSSRSTHRRLITAKSAVLIYAALLGLSPILKSLTCSTTSDSIWALSSWLLLLNVVFFDYSASSESR